MRYGLGLWGTSDHCPNLTKAKELNFMKENVLMSKKLLEEIKKQTYIIKLDSSNTSNQDIDSFFNYIKNKGYQMIFHHGIKQDMSFILVNPVLNHVEIMNYEPVNSFSNLPQISLQEFFREKAV